jgi:hypothetical protein
MSRDPFATPEWRACQAAEMELHIAADRWHDFPADPAICADLHRRVVDYRRTRAAWVLLVATPDEAADLAAELGRGGALADDLGDRPEPTEEVETVDLLAALQASVDRHRAGRSLCKCGHQHASPAADGICIGCPCEERQ